MKRNNFFYLLITAMYCCNTPQQQIKKAEIQQMGDVKSLLTYYNYSNFLNLEDTSLFFIVSENSKFYNSWFFAGYQIDENQYAVQFNLKPAVGYTGLGDSRSDSINFLYTQCYSMKVSSSVWDSLEIYKNEIIENVSPTGEAEPYIQYILYYNRKLYFCSAKSDPDCNRFEPFINFILSNIKGTINYKMAHPKYTIDSSDFSEFKKNNIE